MVVAVVAAIVASRGGGGSSDAGMDRVTGSVPADAVAIGSDAPRHEDLASLVASADVVVRGEVEATERGRWFGGGDAGPRLQSRFVTLRVDDVLAGDDPGRATLLLEEEGWLEDGAPVVVDGAAPSRPGDEGIWFLVDGGDPEVGAHLVVGADGRYLDDGAGGLVGAEGDDPLVDDLAGRTPDDLAAAVRAAA